MSRVKYLFVLLAVALVAGFVWVVLAKSQITLPEAKNNTPRECQQGDGSVCRFIAAWSAVEEYEMRSTTTDKNGKKTEAILRVVGQDSSQLIGYDAGKEVYNWITIANTDYAKDYSDNKWWKQRFEEVKGGAGEYAPVIEKNEGSYRRVSVESCEERRCFKYQVVDPNDKSTRQLIWFDDKDYLLRRMQIIAQDGTVVEMTFWYDQVSVVEPVATKEVKEGEGIVLPDLAPTVSDELRSISDEARRSQ